MARSFGKVLTSIWDDPEWLALSGGAQRVYHLLLSQKRLTLAGCLDLMPSRWARYAADTTVADIWDALTELETAGFVVLDRDTEELLVRTLTTHDLDASRLSAKVIKGLWAAWRAIESPTLRKVAVDNLPELVWERSGQIAPPDAVQMRTSPPIDWRTLHPIERNSAPPIERETPPPIVSPVSSLPLLSPVSAAAYVSRAELSPQPDEHRQQQPTPDPPASRPRTPDGKHPLVWATARLLAARRASRRPDVGEGWIHNATEGIYADRHADALRALQDLDPATTPEQLAAILEPQPAPTQPAHTTPDGAPFIPGIGIATGLPELPEPLPDDDFHAAAITARAALHRPGATP